MQSGCAAELPRSAQPCASQQTSKEIVEEMETPWIHTWRRIRRMEGHHVPDRHMGDIPLDALSSMLDIRDEVARYILLFRDFANARFRDFEIQIAHLEIAESRNA